MSRYSNGKLLFGAALCLVVAVSMGGRGFAQEPSSFSASQKLLSGDSSAPGAKIMATDGRDFYVVSVERGQNGLDERLIVTKVSTDGELAATPTMIDSRMIGLLDHNASVAVAGSTKKTVHAVWTVQPDKASGTIGGVYYARADVSDFKDWHKPLRISGSVTDINSLLAVASRRGEIDVLFTGNGGHVYYVTAHAPKFIFSKPVQIPGVTTTGDGRSVDAALDKNGNLHVAYLRTSGAGRIGVAYVKRRAGKKAWSKPVDVIPPSPVGDRGSMSIAAYDANNVYIASTLINNKSLDVYTSGNGGRSWTSQTVTEVKPSKHASIAVGADKTLTVGVGHEIEAPLSEDAMIFRSVDGRNWQQILTIPQETSVNIVLDAHGKAGVLTRGAVGTDENQAYFTKEQ